MSVLEPVECGTKGGIGRGTARGMRVGGGEVSGDSEVEVTTR
jgi:hypothetical protein